MEAVLSWATLAFFPKAKPLYDSSAYTNNVNHKINNKETKEMSLESGIIS